MTRYTREDVEEGFVTELDLKFNSGIGALLCVCGKVMATGFEHEGKIYECKCGSLHKVERIDTDDPTIYYYGVYNY